MKNSFRFLIALGVTIVLMLIFRALVFTVYAVSGSSLEPCFVSGDRVLVNRWSYGLRTGGNRFFEYERWMSSPVENGDLVVFNNPADTTLHLTCKEVRSGYCTGTPGDTVRVDGAAFVVPGRDITLRVTKQNMHLICYLYNRYEHRAAAVANGKLFVDGHETHCAAFYNDYYWFSSGRRDDKQDSRTFGLVPENHIIGKVAMLLYSIDPEGQFPYIFRPDRWLLFIN